MHFDQGGLEVGQLLDRHPMHVDHRRVHEPDHLLGDRDLLLVAGLEGGDDVLCSGDAAERVIQLRLSLALQEHRRVARVSYGVLDISSLVQQIGVRGRRVQGEQ